MKLLPFIFILLAIVSNISGTRSQTNLVPNGDFESISSCPGDMTTLTLNSVDHWDYVPNMGTGSLRSTPDYFNACATSTQTDVPSNLVGNQNARSGDGYGGIVTREVSYCSWVLSDWTEYYQVELTEPLRQGYCYEAKMYVVLSKNSRYASKNIGMHFSSNQLVGNGASEVIIPSAQGAPNPQIIEPSFITDNSNWTEISGRFYATGGEKFLTIGIFDEISANNHSDEYPNNSLCMAYYLIEDVSLYNLTEFVCSPPPDDGCCLDHVIYEDKSNLPSKTNVYDFIKAEKNNHVLNGQNVTFSAGNYISLKDFNVEKGANFHAKIEYCSQSSNPNPQISLLTSYPNVITPNGDGINDQLCFEVVGATSYSIQIMDRWGNITTLNGNINSNKVCVWGGNGVSAVYWYIITFSNCDNSITSEEHVLHVLTGGSNRQGKPDESGKSIEEHSIEVTPTFSFYPNPVNEELNISIDNPANEVVRIQINSILGNEIIPINNLGENRTIHETINTENFSDGLYIVTVVVGEKVFVEKIFVDR